jgi:hypothetical protein
MKLPHLVATALSLLARACAVASAQDPTGDQETAEPAAASAPNEPSGPMASFARLESGEWRRPALTRVDMFETWHWGPGKHSMLSQTYGFDAEGDPWRSLQVFYWHPGREQVRLLGLEPFASGVSEGTIRFERETAEATMDLYQTGQHRSMGFRWAFDGPDRYHSTLLEDSGNGFEAIAEWDYVRFEADSSMRQASDGGAPRTLQPFEALESLLVGTWGAVASWAGADARRIETKLEWVPHINAIHVRVSAPSEDAPPLPLLDAYLYLHTGTGALRCLALSDRGGVYEGDLTVLEGGALQLDLQGYEGDSLVPTTVVPITARFDFESDGSLRHRVWSHGDPHRTLMLDTHHRQLEARQD